MVRLKHRYLVVHVKGTDKSQPVEVSEHSIRSTIAYTVRYLHGPFGEAATQNGLCVKYVNQHTGLVMIRARRGPHRLVASALALITELRVRAEDLESVSKTNIHISTLYTGACIKQCLLFIKRYQMDEYHKVVGTLSATERQQLKDTYMLCEFTE